MDFTELISRRRSVRQYEAGRHVSPEQILELVTAAQQAPSWKNSQTARYYAAITPEAIASVMAALPDFHKKSATNCCALLVTTFKAGISGFAGSDPVNECGDEWGAYDLGLAGAYLTLKAADMGLDTLIMGIRDAAMLRTAMDIPADETVMAVIAVGCRAGEPAARPRKPISEIVTIR